jgi:hypothetical protein
MSGRGSRGELGEQLAQQTGHSRLRMPVILLLAMARPFSLRPARVCCSCSLYLGSFGRDSASDPCFPGR